MRDEKGHLVYSGFFWKLARPRVILAVNGLLVAAALWFACFLRGLDPGSLGLGTLAGLGIWTLFEYVLHRWITPVFIAAGGFLPPSQSHASCC